MICESPPKREKPPGRAVFRGDTLLVRNSVNNFAQAQTQEAAEELVATLAASPRKDDALLAFAIRTLNGARLELVGEEDINFAFDLLVAERHFVSAVIYKCANAQKHCWVAIARALSRIRLLRKTRK